ncbi:hypothetical protein BKA57DRAFT_245676 [Linnemannia elongata]|nr:hypothetical protein BKA57DRAFT_245676 [Linnemannia elongata]
MPAPFFFLFSLLHLCFRSSPSPFKPQRLQDPFPYHTSLPFLPLHSLFPPSLTHNTTMIKSILALATIATMASAQGLTHISFTQPVGDGITYEAGTNQTFSWTMACTSPSTLVSATPNATEVDFMDSNNINNAFFVKKVGTIDCTKSVGNLVWTVPADTKPGVYALQFLLAPNNAYSGRFNVTTPGNSGSGGAGSGGEGAAPSSPASGGAGAPTRTAGSGAASLAVSSVGAVVAGGAALAMLL